MSNIQMPEPDCGGSRQAVGELHGDLHRGRYLYSGATRQNSQEKWAHYPR